MQEASIPTDASALIHLAKLDSFETAFRCVGNLRVPPSVWREVVELGDAQGALDVPVVHLAESLGYIQRAALSPDEAAKARAIAIAHRLGAGECEVLAMASHGQRVILDEGRGTRLAQFMGILPVPTLMLPLFGVRNRTLDLSEALEFLWAITLVSGARADLFASMERRLRRAAR
ncbi:MAG: hypothetical protein ABIU54_06720 [Candidatus Eisenbacteria bacterium]